MDVKASTTCPQEIAYGRPAIVVVDNDDFKIDSLTGNATGAHRTNVMFVQPEKYEKKPDKSDTRHTKKKEISEQLSQMCAELTHVHQYKCPAGSKSEPSARPVVDPPVNGTSR